MSKPSARIIVQDQNGHFLLATGSRSIIEPLDSINFGPNNEMTLELLIEVIHKKLNPAYSFNKDVLKTFFTQDQLNSSLSNLGAGAGITVWNWIINNLIPRLTGGMQNYRDAAGNIQVHFINDDNNGIKIRLKAYKVNTIGGEKNAGEHSLLAALREFREETNFTFLPAMLGGHSEEEMNNFVKENLANQKIEDDKHRLEAKVIELKTCKLRINNNELILIPRINSNLVNYRSQRDERNRQLPLSENEANRQYVIRKIVELNNQINLYKEEHKRLINENITEEKNKDTIINDLRDIKNLIRAVPEINYNVPKLPIRTNILSDILYNIHLEHNGESFYFIRVSNGQSIIDAYTPHALQSELFNLRFVDPNNCNNVEDEPIDRIHRLLANAQAQALAPAAPAAPAPRATAAAKRDRDGNPIKEKYLKYKAKYLSLKKMLKEMNLL